MPTAMKIFMVNYIACPEAFRDGQKKIKLTHEWNN